MNLIPFEKQHIPQAQELALACYNEERLLVAALPALTAIPNLDQYAGNGLSVAAVEGEQLVGFLCGCPPFPNAFRSTTATGIFSPMGAHAALARDRETIYARMYQAAAETWVQAGAVSHGICLYAHDQAAQRQFFRYGFGMRCVDAIREMNPTPITTCPGYTFTELPQTDWAQVYPLELALHEHYLQSPFFMRRQPDTLEGFLSASTQQHARYFAAKQQGSLCAYVKITGEGETFLAGGDGYRHVHGAYCQPKHRGQGLYAHLLHFAMDALRQDGCTRLGVDYESINPTAWGFWGKHFDAYTHSVVRRIDENILR
ncbi:MAG: GNAT family N-acetyltransferase [Clostridia bacterium]|nr:GNAT family N-acetyltransferase [Clostridia bacterium]